MYNAVGGSTIHWSAHFPRFHPSDFRTKTLDGVADDWPLSYEELEPYFDLNDRIMGVAGMTGDTAYPPKSARQTPPIPLGAVGQTMARGFDRLGWHWWPSDSAILTAPYDGRAACNNCGPCDIGCARGSKSSTDITYWPKALALGAQLKTRCRVREITVGRDGLADGVLYYDADGNLQERKARTVVLACNGVGTARLMLNSRSAMFPDGLANSSGLCGQEPDVPSILDGDGRVRGTSGRIQRAERRGDSKPGVLRNGSLSRLRSRIRLPGRAKQRAGHHRAGRHNGQADSLGAGTSRQLQEGAGTHHHHRGHRRGPARTAQRGHARS